MQRAKREALKKEAGMTKEEIEYNTKLSKLIKEIHYKKFPEEYDFMMDSNADAIERRRGKNPMSKEYIEKVNKKREKEGVSPLGEDGIAQSSDTMEVCKKLAKKELI